MVRWTEIGREPACSSMQREARRELPAAALHVLHPRDRRDFERLVLGTDRA
jgi:hypothetical protein